MRGYPTSFIFLLLSLGALAWTPVLTGCGAALEDSVAAKTDDSAPKDGLEELFGTRLQNADGEETTLAELEGKKVGLYFSAHWCPPCRAFTPLLVDAYNQLQADGKPFEIVFVSSDRSAEAMRAYMKEYDMDWLALPFEAEQRSALAQRFGVRGIPTLVVVDADGRTLSADARNQVAQWGAGAYERW